MNAIEETKRINDEYNFFNEICEVKPSGKGKLSGYYVSVKDCIVVKDVESRSGSAILSGYKPVFDATVVKMIKEEGGTIIGKTAQDEFGFGSFSVNVGKGMKIPLNPIDKERSCGGSSGGAAGFTKKAPFKHIAIAESTGGSIVCPASFCGVYGLCPTYGLVSRYGLMDYASSLDKIGVMAKRIDEIALGLSVIAGHDEKDATSATAKKEDYGLQLSKGVKGMKIGIIKESLGKGTDREISKKVMEKIKVLEEKGVTIKEVPLPLNAKYSLAAYYLIAMCEASTNLAKYCGMRYGKHAELKGGFDEYFSSVRSANFGDEVKRRIIMGTFARMTGFRDAYYIKALKARTMMIEEYRKAFMEFDALISPTMPVIAPKFSEIKKMSPLQNYMMDILGVGPNLAGMPHISCPAGEKEGMPIGIMVTGNQFEEGKIIRIAKALENGQ
ncbi:aspartyl/glutamyl-tRNA amidotransferase subunit A [Candidatus Woesearchaeota archaeon]|nr:aspartyl/glutamyl-tRNA amidotransferase subunit A [Candidatus Woesearchaeota archaeon]